MVFCENAATVEINNKGHSTILMNSSLMLRLTWTCVLNNFILQAASIPGHENCVADALSCFKFQEFKTKRPQAKPSSMPCPPFSQMMLV